MNKAGKKIPPKARKAKTKKQLSSDSLPLSKDSLTVVGIGASAGGLEALELFFSNLPPSNDLAFVVVQHLSPDYKSLMAELLSKQTGMQVLRAEDGMKVEGGTLYVIPPKKNITIFNSKLYLMDQEHSHGLNLPIDIFFRSLAEDKGDRAIGIVMSGTGSDGTLGIRAIKGAGGMVMAQDMKSAKFDGMPRSAINTGLVDYILTPEKMPEELVKYIKHPYIHKSDKIDEMLLKEGDSLSKILAVIRDRTGIDFSSYRPTTVVRRIERRISINHISSIEDYVNFVAKSFNESLTLAKELLIGVTRFFRDTEAYDTVKNIVIPAICEKTKQNETLRVWCVGCSTGEEAYSLAILFSEHLDSIQKKLDIKIFATDVDKDAIEYAGVGIYPESIVADISADRLKRFFVQADIGWRVNEKIRRMVVFAAHNITSDPPFSKIEFVSCRNLLIYFKPEIQKKVLSSLSFSLNCDGYLFLGNSESIGELESRYSVVDKKWKIYRNTDTFKPITQANLTSISSRLPFKTVMSSSHKPPAIDESLQSVYQSLINEYAPPAVVVDENFDVLHIFGDVNKYIKLPHGRMSLNLLKMVSKDFSLVLNTAFYKALKDKQEILYKGYKLNEDDRADVVTVKVKPITDEFTQKELLLISFESFKCKEPLEQDIQTEDLQGLNQQRISDLEQEVLYTRENLQASIEELGTSNEELQSTNEELIASNEELQSTNEELQSVNEELYTVNSEYQKKIEELTQLNNDIINLIRSTDIGTIFLDKKLIINRYTPAVTATINLMESDIGRPINHISTRFNYPGFIDEIKEVMATLIAKEAEIHTIDNLWFLMHISPYRTIDNEALGIVITFVDITERKKMEERLRESEQAVRLKLESILNPEGNIGNLELGDIINTSDVQSLMDDFYKLTNIGIGIIDLAGKVLVGTGWQDVCVNYHRVNSESCKNCIQSDLILSNGVAPGEFKLYKCKNNMWDISTPIMIGDKKVGNLFLGQFLYSDETINYKVFRSQARKYGFNEKKYLEALERVPRWSKETVDTAMNFYIKFAAMLSKLSFNNIWLARSLEDRNRAEQALQQYTGQVQNLSRFLFKVQETERRSIARELHDEIGQMLTVINLSLETAASRTSSGEMHKILDEIQESVGQLLGKVRDLSLNLRPSMLDDLGLVHALQWQFNRFTNNTKIKIMFRHSTTSNRFNPEVETAAYRIVQEAITNIARHASTEEAEVVLTENKEKLFITIEDKGKGFDSKNVLANGNTLGLPGMRERLTMLGGSMTIISSAETGTRISIEIPKNITSDMAKT
ncbi:MAG: PocR ligand-binding domain-containing protein [Nitrospirae bacterium]|nr:PocR ligand-binding domain-containing protein [Nitrospirota bacterium]